MRIWLLTGVFFLLIFTAKGQFTVPAKSLPLFTVGKSTFTTDEFLYTYKKNHQNKDNSTEKDVNEYLNLLIIFKLKVAEARSRGLDTTAKFNNEFKTYREELKKPYRTEPDALDKLTKETYQRLTEEVNAAHILITVKPDAISTDTLTARNKIADIKKRIEAGEDFEKLAAELSEDPSAKYNYGDLGFFTALQMVYPFEEAAYRTEVGSISPIIRTQFGYHLVKVMARKPARGEVEVSHILIRTGTSNDEKVKSMIFSLYDQLKAGRSWEEVCKEYSEDGNTKESGGRLRPFGVGALASVPEFEALAFSMQMPGEISDPFQSNLGWHIIRLEKKIPLPSYKEMEVSLKRRVGRDERLQLSQQVLNAKRRTEFGFSEEKQTKLKVLELADSSLTAGIWEHRESPELAGSTLIAVSGSSFTVESFTDYVLSNHKASNLSPTVYMNQLYESFVEEKILEAEEEKLKREHPDFKNLLTEYHEGILLFEIMENEVWNRASIDSTGQRRYYEQNTGSYQAGDRIEARIFTADSKSLIDEIKNKVSKGDTLNTADMKRFKSIQNFRAYEMKDSQVIDKINWSAGLHEVESDGLFYLVEVKRLVAPGIKTFEEARSQVISDFQDKLEKDWVQDLRKKYPIKVNKKGKKFVLGQLTRK
jgi:peptidyl-prolyl cis-trans isomerase SurA